MRLDTPFYRLPLKYDVQRLAEEVSQFSEDEWLPHPQGHKGNSALPLISAGGSIPDQAVRGPMRPTPYLDRCPYIRQILSSLRTVLGRTRLMRIDGGGEATPHVDTNYYWMHHVRVHIPAITVPEVEFLCGDAKVHMPAGETWIFDTWRRHNVLNPNDRSRIHLVADTVGSAAFWELVHASEKPGDETPAALPDQFIPFQPNAPAPLDFEGFNFPVVMSPWEQECLVADFLDQLASVEETDPNTLVRLQATLIRHNRHWRALWAQYAERPEGHAAFGQANQKLQQDLAEFVDLYLPNGLQVVEALMQGIVRSSLNPDLADASFAPRMPPSQPMPGPKPQPAAAVTRKVVAPPAPVASTQAEPIFDRPIIIVAAPRSGSTLLFETLAKSPDLWTIGGESHEIFESDPKLTPAARHWESNRLLSSDADVQTAQQIRTKLLGRLRDRDGKPLPEGTQTFRFLEKTPKNALRIPFLRTVFPDAQFIYLYRNPRENISSIIDAWKSGRFVTYPQLPGWSGPSWSLLLIPEWKQLLGKPVEEIAARQWAAAHEQMLRDLSVLPHNTWTTVSYEELLTEPQAAMERLCKFSRLTWDQKLEGDLPLSRHTLTPPEKDKWKKNATLLDRVLPEVEDTDRKVRSVVNAVRHGQPRFASGENEHSNGKGVPVEHQALSSVFTESFRHILESLRISLVVSTYQAGKLILVRGQGSTVNTHFRNIPYPMGVAFKGSRMAIGSQSQVWEFRNQPEVGKKLEPVGMHDACYMPRWSHFTGDIKIHEIAYAGDELWAVNTRFSCLCTFDRDHSFVPRWRPSFVSALAPEDRCHLNGLAVVNGVPKYVTCLGMTDTAGGWRENKRNGGLLMDVTTGEVLLSGLSMPHSPRWYQDKLWVLESGDGGIGYLDSDGQLVTVARVPGFTRGLTFVGNLAFIGLSQIRETATFSGLPLTERLQERACGVWVVDISNGKTVAFLRFDSGVEEIFAVEALPGIVYPDLINEPGETIDNSFVLPDEALAEVPAEAVSTR